MTILQFTNNAQTTIASPISNSATSVTLAAGGGALFPTPSAGQGFYLTFSNAPTPSSYEIVFCSARSGDTLTIVRGQDGTSAAAWNTGDFAGLYATAADLNSMVQIDQLQNGKYQVAGSVAGTGNAITATLTSNLTAIPANMSVIIPAAAANTGAATLDLTIGVTDTGVIPIVKGGNTALVAGDIPSAGYPIKLVYSSTYSAWVMQNPTVAPTAVTVTGSAAIGVTGLPGVRGKSRNLVVSATGGNAQVSITADEIVLENASGAYIVLRNVSVALTLTSSGANGLDSGSPAFSTPYFAYVIYNPTTSTPGALASLNNATAAGSPPTLPSGYPYYARVSGFFTQAATSFFPLSYRQRDDLAQYVVGGANVSALPIFIPTGGSGFPGTGPTIAKSVAAFVPATAKSIKLVCTGTAGTNNEMVIAPNANYGGLGSATNPPPIALGTIGNSGLSITNELLLESGNIYYATQGNAIAQVLGWRDSL